MPDAGPGMGAQSICAELKGARVGLTLPSALAVTPGAECDGGWWGGRGKRQRACGVGRTRSQVKVAPAAAEGLCGAAFWPGWGSDQARSLADLVATPVRPVPACVGLQGYLGRLLRAPCCAWPFWATVTG